MSISRKIASHILLFLLTVSTALGFVEKNDSWEALVIKSELKDTDLVKLFGKESKYQFSEEDLETISDAYHVLSNTGENKQQDITKQQWQKLIAIWKACKPMREEFLRISKYANYEATIFPAEIGKDMTEPTSLSFFQIRTFAHLNNLIAEYYSQKDKTEHAVRLLSVNASFSRMLGQSSLTMVESMIGIVLEGCWIDSLRSIIDRHGDDSVLLRLILEEYPFLEIEYSADRILSGEYLYFLNSPMTSDDEWEEWKESLPLNILPELAEAVERKDYLEYLDRELTLAICHKKYQLLAKAYDSYDFNSARTIYKATNRLDIESSSNRFGNMLIQTAISSFDKVFEHKYTIETRSDCLKAALQRRLGMPHKTVDRIGNELIWNEDSEYYWSVGIDNKAGTDDDIH